MIHQLRAHLERAAYRRKLQNLRNGLAVGDRVLFIRGEQAIPAVVLNVRRYTHGSAEAWVQGDDFQYAGWISVEAILPEEARR